MIGVIGLLQMLLEMRVMDSDWCQVTSPRAFMVIDDKGGEEHGLKLKLGTGEKEKSRRKSQFRVSVLARPVRPVRWTGLTGHHSCTLKL